MEAFLVLPFEPFSASADGSQESDTEEAELVVYSSSYVASSPFDVAILRLIWISRSWRFRFESFGIFTRNLVCVVESAKKLVSNGFPGSQATKLASYLEDLGSAAHRHNVKSKPLCNSHDWGESHQSSIVPTQKCPLFACKVLYCILLSLSETQDG